MWTFEKVEETWDDMVLRDVIGEFNDLICGMGTGDAPNLPGIDAAIWRKLLAYGGLSPEGVEKAVAGEPLSQRDTVGPFRPFTILTIHECLRGDPPLLEPEEADHVITKILQRLGRLDAEGNVAAE